MPTPSVRYDTFVNPYQFAPLPDVVLRRTPPGHDGREYHPAGNAGPAEELYSGAIEVEWVLDTPLLLPRTENSDGHDTVDGHIRIPGASVKGALRSLHEAMFRGCLRVVDEDYVPTYRSATKSKDNTWWLAQVVRSTGSGRPLEVRLCGDIDWLDGPQLRAAYKRNPNLADDLPRTGDVIDVAGAAEDTTLGRFEMRFISEVRARYRPTDKAIIELSNGDRTLATPAPADHRLLLVTDIGARRDTTRKGDRGRCLWASGVLSNEPLQVPESVYNTFLRVCQDSDDHRRLLAPQRAQAGRRLLGKGADSAENKKLWQRKTVHEQVHWWPDYLGRKDPKIPIAERALVTGLLFPGDVVWLQLSADETQVLQIESSQIWRESGTGILRRRIPASTRPCWDPGFEEVGDSSGRPPRGLCLSCEIFGAIDADGDRDKESGGRQTAYAGHLRCGSAVATTEVTLETVDLAPLGAPHLGAGMFYLSPPLQLSSQRGDHDLPGRWGKSPDDARLRPLRGRKFYWHADPFAQADFWREELGRPVTPRHKLRSHQRDSGEPRQLVPARTQFRQTLTVDCMSATALQTLLATLEPHRVLDQTGRRFALHLGGGKPLGLGTVTARIDTSRSTIKPVRELYSNRREAGATHPLPEIDAGVLNARTDPRAAAALARLLDVNGLGDLRHNVSYPTTRSWREVGTEKFDQSFSYFTDNTGEKLRRGDKPWAPLPDMSDTTKSFDPSQSVTPPPPPKPKGSAGQNWNRR